MQQKPSLKCDKVRIRRRKSLAKKGIRYILTNGKYEIIYSYGPREQITVDGMTTNDFHTGIDMSAPEGTPVRAVLDGEVISVTEDPVHGNRIIIDHDNEGVPKTNSSHLDTVNEKKGR